MQFNTGDWLKDPKLSMCLPATRGIWIDAVAAMHEDGRSGSLSGTPCQLTRVLRCTESALMAAIDDLQTTGAADVTVRNGNVTLINRRMNREAKIREANRLRQAKCRGHTECHSDVTTMSQPSGYSYISDSSIKKRINALFDSFYQAYPRKENPRKARAEFQRSGITEEMMPQILDWLEKAKKSEQWTDKCKIPHPSTWLHQRRWEGDPPPPPCAKRQTHAPSVAESLFGAKP